MLNGLFEGWKKIFLALFAIVVIFYLGIVFEIKSIEKRQLVSLLENGGDFLT